MHFLIPWAIFTVSDLPAGSQVLDIDTSKAKLAPNGAPYAGFREKLELIEAINNIVERPFFLPRIDTRSLETVDPKMTTTVTSDLGVSITVFPHSAKDALGNDFEGELSISLVPRGLAPAALPEELNPGLLITIQPVGVTFEPPARITFPNTDGLPVGSEVDIWSLDPDTGGFVIVGRGRINEDNKIETITGGIRATDWHFAVPRAPNAGLATDGSENNSDSQDQSKCTDCPVGSRTAVSSGNLSIEHSLASYRSSGQSRALRLVYNSLRANPQPITSANAAIPLGGPVPLSISSRLSIARVDQGIEVFTDTGGLSSGVELRQSVQFDAASFETGLYPFRLTLTGNYALSSVSNVLEGSVLINNQRNSPFGAGWTLEGLGRLTRQNNNILLTEGDGSVLVFTEAALGTGTFSGPTDSQAGTQPASLVAGDFNGDEILDLAVANEFSDDLSILLGDGNGTFSAPTSLSLGGVGFRTVMVTGDFNGDTSLDLAISGEDVSVLLGDGSGAFSSPSTALSGKFRGIAVGDFTGDEILDLAVIAAGGISDQLSILVGDGVGGFAPDFSIPVFARSVTVADFNGDEILDLALTNAFTDVVSILLGTGMGAFSGPTHFAAGDLPNSLAVGDFNGDEILDLATANHASRDISILLGNGTGAFSSPTHFAASGAEQQAIATADFDGDRILDLAVAYPNFGQRIVSILLGDGTGLFSAPTNIAFVGKGPRGIVVEDFNGDEIPDLATADVGPILLP